MTYKIFLGDALDKLKELDSNSIDCVLTSPPYWQKRDNNTPGQIGLEPLYTDYLKRLLQVFAEVKRVLKPSGTCWVVIDDTTNGNKVGNTNGITTNNGSATVKQKAGLREFGTKGVNKKLQQGIPDHALLKIPWRLCIAMEEQQGWINTNEIVWYKSNGQPNTAKKRCTYGYDERIILFFNDWAKVDIRIPSVPSKEDPSKLIYVNQVWEIQTEQSDYKHYSSFPMKLADRIINAGSPEGGTVLDPFMGSGTTGISALRNKRNFIGIDISPEYVQMAEERLRELSSGVPTASGKNNEDNGTEVDPSAGNKKKKTFTLDDF
jgi:site-specific DNA-methyltransferase (cytosine-N4-specific)